MKIKLHGPFMKFILLFCAFNIIGLNSYAQQLIWAKKRNLDTSDRPTQVLNDNASNIYWLYCSYGLSQPGIEKLNKFNKYGVWKWAVTITNIGADRPPQIAIDDSANIYLSGTFISLLIINGTDSLINTNTIGKSIYIIKIDSSGSVVYSKQITTGACQNYFPYLEKMKCDNSGNLIITGTFACTVNFNLNGGNNSLSCDTSLGFTSNRFLCKYDGNANLIWAKNIPVNSVAYPSSSFDIDGNNNIIFFDGAIGDYDPDIGIALFNDSIGRVLAKYDSSGNYLWSKILPVHRFTGFNNTGLVNQVTVDFAGNITLFSSFRMPFDADPGNGVHVLIPNNPTSENLLGEALFSSSYNSLGEFRWARSFYQTGNIIVNEIKSDSFGNCYITGIFSDTIDLDADDGSSMFYGIATGIGTPIGYHHFFSSYDSLGGYRYGFKLEDSWESGGSNCCIDNDNNLILAGYFRGTIDVDPSFGNYILTQDSSLQNNFNDLFIAKYGLASYNICSGKVFSDINQNNFIDTLDQPTEGINVHCFQTGLYYETNSNGDYKVIVSDTGLFDLQIPNLPQYYSATIPSVQNSYFNTFLTIDSGNNFLLQPIPGIHDLSISIIPFSSVMRHGLNHYRLILKNKGTASESGIVVLKYDSNLIYISTTYPYTSMLGDSITWTYSNLQPMNTLMIDVTFNLPVTIPSYLTHTYVTALPILNDTVPADNIDSIQQLIVFAFDPNEKYVFPENGISPAQVADSIYINYQISFQNVGNDTAFSVIVVDTLNNNLNISSFELVATSNPCHVLFDNSHIAKFIFNNINLPDSNVNEKLSHGFIKYRIRPNSNLILGDTIHNKASIYFNIESPIITNTVVTPVTTIFTGLNINVPNTYNKIYPNPANNISFLDYICTDKTNRQFVLVDITGKELYKIELKCHHNRITLNCSGFDNGIYIYKVLKKGIIEEYGKLVISR